MGHVVGDLSVPVDLLEEFWFFANLFDGKPNTISRSLSDPSCTSSSNFKHDMINIPEKSFDEIFASIENQRPLKGGSEIEIKKPTTTTIMENLPRAPSLPISLRSDDYQDEDVEFSMGKLIRQASINSSDTIRRRVQTQPAKVAPLPELESLEFKKLRPQQPINQIKTQKSLSHIDSLQSQGFKDLGFDFDKKCMLDEEHGGKNSRRLYRCDSAAPKWAAEKMSTEDMKAQLKFWARAVASNVRLEC